MPDHDAARPSALEGAHNWAWGDFNQDLRVDGRDFALLAANFGRGTSPGELTQADRSALHAFAAAVVPEPVYSAWLLVALAALTGRVELRLPARRPFSGQWRR